jgi:formylglycine-generating enzyme
MHDDVKTFRVILAFVLALAISRAGHADTFGTGANSFSIEFVAIGNPGVPGDVGGAPSAAGYVPYAFRIGKYEVTEQMIDVANAAGGLGLFKDTRGPDKPATSVNWFNAARFVNWLNTSTGAVPAYKFDGNGNFQLWSPGDAGYNGANRYRNTLARYFLPSVDEWFKAAYYDPASGAYHDYPTGTGALPTPIAGGTAANSAVYDQPISAGPADVHLAGSPSPYGTIGQGGNVWEWEETDFDLVNNSISSQYRGLRGGSYAFPATDMLAFRRNFGGLPGNASEHTGFRVASVPEPSTVMLTLGCAVAISARSRRRRR